jgi:hypothetical protein
MPGVHNLLLASNTVLFLYRIMLFDIFINCMIFGTYTDILSMCSLVKSTTSARRRKKAENPCNMPNRCQVTSDISDI